MRTQTNVVCPMSIYDQCRSFVKMKYGNKYNEDYKNGHWPSLKIDLKPAYRPLPIYDIIKLLH